MKVLRQQRFERKEQDSSTMQTFNQQKLNKERQDDLTHSTVGFLSDMSSSISSKSFVEEDSSSNFCISWTKSSETVESNILVDNTGLVIQEGKTALREDIINLLKLRQPQHVINIFAFVICFNKFFSMMEIFLALIIAGFIQRRNHPLLEKILRRLSVEAEERLKETFRPIFLVVGSHADLLTSSEIMRLQREMKRLARENQNLKSSLEAEVHAQGRKEVILESEHNNVKALEQSCQLMRALLEWERKSFQTDRANQTSIEKQLKIKIVQLVTEVKKRDQLVVSMVRNINFPEPATEHINTLNRIRGLQQI
jgi:hypothetical protein